MGHQRHSLHILRRATIGGRIAAVATTVTLIVMPASAATTTYSYAGLTTQVPVTSVSATITYVERAKVEGGAIAAWVGVGGPGLGEKGEDAWIQVGFNSYDAYAGVVLYYELERGKFYKYTIVKGGQTVGNHHRFMVQERSDRPNWWRAWIDGRGVGPLFHLPGSHGKWTGRITAEVFKSRPTACNSFVFAMRDIDTSGHRSLSEGKAAGHPVPVDFEQGLHIGRTTTGERLARSSCPTRSNGPSDAHDQGGQPSPSGSSSSGSGSTASPSDASDRR
jgi:hypothetical protein